MLPHTEKMEKREFYATNPDPSVEGSNENNTMKSDINFKIDSQVSNVWRQTVSSVIESIGDLVVLPRAEEDAAEDKNIIDCTVDQNISALENVWMYSSASASSEQPVIDIDDQCSTTSTCSSISMSVHDKVRKCGVRDYLEQLERDANIVLDAIITTSYSFDRGVNDVGKEQVDDISSALFSCDEEEERLKTAEEALGSELRNATEKTMVQFLEKLRMKDINRNTAVSENEVDAKVARAPIVVESTVLKCGRDEGNCFFSTIRELLSSCFMKKIPLFDVVEDEEAAFFEQSSEGVYDTFEPALRL